MAQYPGGKNGPGIFHRIISAMPPHEVYIEPFLGSGAVMRHKRPAAINYGLDLSPAAVESFMREASLELVMAAARPVLTAMSGGARGSGSISGSGVEGPQVIVGVGNGLEFLRGFRFRGSELVYCDPPYLMATRSSGRMYEHEMSDVDHRRLLRWAIAARCRVMISGYPSKMYARALQGWRCCSYQASTRGGSTEECLWMNFPEPVALHDYRYLGNGFRDRERLTKKKKRWVRKLLNLPLLERQALLWAISTAGIDDGARLLHTGK